MSDETASQPAAEAGWTHWECPACGEVVYDGRQISATDLGELVGIHRVACEATADESPS